jgi:hypothetical protein
MEYLRYAIAQPCKTIHSLTSVPRSPGVPAAKHLDSRRKSACDSDAREAVKALIVANQFLETELEKLKAAVSTGYARGQLLPRDRKDWYD